MPNTGNSMYIYNMPYQKLEALGKILDNKETWKSLGGLMQYDTQTIQEFERAERQGKSPSIELLNNWSKQNHTVFELFTLLYKMKHFQAMMVLKPLVEDKYHQYIYEGNHCASELSDAAAGLPSTSLSLAKGLGVMDEKTLAYGKHNWNVMVPEPAKLNKETFPDSQPKIQNIRLPVSQEENNPKHEKLAAVPSGQCIPAALGIRKLGSGLEKCRLSPAGIAALAAGQQQIPSLSNTAQNQNHLAINLPSPSTPQRKLSDASLAASPSEWSTLPQCDYKDLETATQNWSRSCIVGRGGFGTVFVGNWKNTKVAIKRLELPKGQTRESQEVQIQQSLTELSILQSIRHDNILQLYGFSLGGNHPCLVYQFMENGSLEDRLQRKDSTKNPLNWQQRYNIAKGTAKGVQYLHTVLEKPLIHGDIKSANILLDSNFEPRIGDFGLAREGPQTQYTHMEVSRVHGTKPYLPDEFLRSKKLSTKVDTYSFGVVLFELTTGQRAYEEKRTNKLLKDEVTSRPLEKLFELIDGKAGNSCVEYFQPLILLGIKCVSKNTKERPEMEEVWRTLDQFQVGGTGQPSPYELQVRYDEWSQHRRQSQSHTPQVPALAGNSNLPARNKAAATHSINGHPSSVGQGLSQGLSHAGGQTSPNNIPESSCPFAFAPGSVHNLANPINVGQVGNLRVAENPAQVLELLVPATSAAPLRSPTISVIPATSSRLSASSSQSSLESSSVYSSHTSQNAVPNELESQSGDGGPGDIPLLSVLGTVPTSVPRTLPNPED